MNEYRVTKYNPAFRDELGHHTRPEWIMFKDIGETYSGVLFTREEYERVEDAYVQAALSFLRESGLSSIRVAGIENRSNQPLDFDNGSVLPLDRIGEIICRTLREEIYCRLEGSDCFVHFGWDYYMYVGVPHRCPRSQALAAELGLFVEEFASPVRESLEESKAEDEAEP
jgi:hypothetical protein